MTIAERAIDGVRVLDLDGQLSFDWSTDGS